MLIEPSHEGVYLYQTALLTPTSFSSQVSFDSHCSLWAFCVVRVSVNPGPAIEMASAQASFGG